MLQTMQWTGQSLRRLDQTKLPIRTEYLDITDEKQMWDAIRRLVVRGAPAIGVAAGYGAYLGIKDFTGDAPALLLRLNEVCDYLATSRPTAVNLTWALKRIQRVALGGQPVGARLVSPFSAGEEGRTSVAPTDGATAPKHPILRECLCMLEEDKQSNCAIGIYWRELPQ